MNIQSLLEDIGLKPREVEVYLALLELGEASVQKVAIKAGLQRPNCYAVLESLTQKGLANQLSKSGSLHYTAEDPTRLTGLLEERLKALDTFLPQLRSIHNSAPSKPKVRFYEGKESINQLYQDVLGKSERYDCIYCPEDLEPVWGLNYITQFGFLAAEHGMKIRELVGGNLRPVPYEVKYRKPRQEIRYLAPEVIVQTDLILFANSVALVSYKPNMHALVIEGSGIVRTIQTMFDLIWAATPPTEKGRS